MTSFKIWLILNVSQQIKQWNVCIKKSDQYSVRLCFCANLDFFVVCSNLDQKNYGYLSKKLGQVSQKTFYICSFWILLLDTSGLALKYMVSSVTMNMTIFLYQQYYQTFTCFSRKVPEYTINLDDPPIQRWNKLAYDKRHEVMNQGFFGNLYSHSC